MLVDAGIHNIYACSKKKSGGRSGRIDSDNAAGAVLDGEDTEDKSEERSRKSAFKKESQNQSEMR